MDGDTTKLSAEFFRIIFDQLRSTNFEGDYYRQRDRFPREAIARFPLLHSFDFMWNDLISDLSMRTDQAWTIGRCTLISVGAHCAAGGVMPFRLVNGVDEDIRIGTHINLLRNRRGERSHAIQIQEHVLESDPARALRGMSEVLDAVNRAGVGEPIPLTRDLHEAARLLKYYRNFHDLHLTDPLSYAEPNLGWLGSEGEFERALPRRALELCANSYFQLAQEELYLERLREESRIAEMIYGLFESGRHPYSSARDLVFRWRAQKDLPQEVTGRPPLNPQVIESIHHDCAAEAAQLMCDILERQGIIARVRSDVRGYAPATGKADEVLPQPIEVVESALYRAKLREMLM
jgi:hypothetical protein